MALLNLDDYNFVVKDTIKLLYNALKYKDTEEIYVDEQTYITNMVGDLYMNSIILLKM